MSKKINKYENFYVLFCNYMLKWYKQNMQTPRNITKGGRYAKI